MTPLELKARELYPNRCIDDDTVQSNPEYFAFLRGAKALEDELRSAEDKIKQLDLIAKQEIELTGVIRQREIDLHKRIQLLEKQLAKAKELTDAYDRDLSNLKERRKQDVEQLTSQLTAQAQELLAARELLKSHLDANKAIDESLCGKSIISLNELFDICKPVRDAVNNTLNFIQKYGSGK